MANPLDRLRALLEVATPGPLETGGSGWRAGREILRAGRKGRGARLGEMNSCRDALAIAAVMSVAPQLLAVVEAVEEHREGIGDGRALWCALEDVYNAINSHVPAECLGPPECCGDDAIPTSHSYGCPKCHLPAEPEASDG